MTGDGLQDLVLVRNGSIGYWPSLGHGSFGPIVRMVNAPRFPDGHDPRRVLLGDIDGDGVADLVYVDAGRVLLWGNHTGNAWSPGPIVIAGTPSVVNADDVRLTDLYGTGMAGLVWSRAAGVNGEPFLRFLDFTGGMKPHLLDAMDNHLGAVTSVSYRSSTSYCLADQANPATRWRTPLPIPVHVVARTEVNDRISSGRLVTEYRYHHGYWDGAEREFRGFARVEHLDAETFRDGAVHHSPPTLTKIWFHPGPVASGEAQDWTELDLTHEYWPQDPPQLARSTETTGLLASLPAGARRDALRALRGQVLRTELYALDGTDRADRPYTVTESIAGVRVEADRVYFPFPVAQRTTQWERGTDPMTQYTFTADQDRYGFPTAELAVSVPRGRNPEAASTTPSSPYLATVTTTQYARHDDEARYVVDRACRATIREVFNDGTLPVPELRDVVFAGAPSSTAVSLRVVAHARTFYDGDAFTGLPLGELGDHGLPVRAERLAFTDAFIDELFDPTDPATVSPRPVFLDPAGPTWTNEYPPEFRASLPHLAGYRHYADSEIPGSPGGYYVVESRHRYDVHDPTRRGRGLTLASLDPLGSPSRIEYDEHDLLPVHLEDAAGLTTTASYDLRLLHPVEVVDVNGNTRAVTYSPAGLVTAQFVRGKGGEGDRDLPGVRLDYDLTAFSERGRPVSVRSTRRAHHDTDTGVPHGERDDVLVSVEYCDGFGRVLQTRTQAEDTLFGDTAFGGQVILADLSLPGDETSGRARLPGEPDHVIVSGWQTFDNKGRVVEQYEPFYSVGFEYAPPGDIQFGQKATIFYDPRGHAVRTMNPDGSEQLVVLGVPVDLADRDVYAPTPWESFSYDANDNAGRTHPAEATAYSGHWNTPASAGVDALGRTVVATVRNGPDPADWFITGSTYDIQGNLVGISDALDRPAFTYRFDLLHRRWRMDSIDAGRRDTVPDAIGNPIEERDAKGSLTLGSADRMHRPARVWARDDATSPITLRQRVEYGDAGDPDQPAGERAAALARNLLGRAVVHYDEAGLESVFAVDFKGNPLDAARRVIADAPLLATYVRAAAEGWRVQPLRVDWDQDPGQWLNPAEYRTTTSYDALNRVTRQLLPADVTGHREPVDPVYNRAGGLAQVWLDGTLQVQRIAYDAKGQRTLIAYGNGLMTRYAHDPRTFRLTRLRTEGYTLAGDTYRPRGPVLQDYGYGYDLVGNHLTLRDRTPGSGIPGTPAGADALDRAFGYDPAYRLLSATGRECAVPPAGPPWTDVPRCSDVTQARSYIETYTYDRVGNLLRLGHDGGSAGGFVREFTIAGDSNRLRRMTTSGTPFDYEFDANGNLIAETTSRHFAWNHADRLATFATQTAGAEPSVHAHYLYDASGERVTKLVRSQGGGLEVTHFLGGVEHRRWGGPTTGENTLVHVMDDHSRIALVRVGPAAPGDGGPAVQFHLGDHLGSSTVIADETGVLTNREEFTPYGGTSFGSYARKRYRFTGKERDEESGLNYHAARYFSSATARWLSCDPAGSAESVNLYGYERGNPMTLLDPTGKSSESQAALFRVIDVDRNNRLDSTELVTACVTEKAMTDLLLDVSAPDRYTADGYAARDALLEPFNRSNEKQLRLYSDSPSPMTMEQHRAFVEDAESARQQARLLGFDAWVNLVASMGLPGTGGGSAKGVSLVSRVASP